MTHQELLNMPLHKFFELDKRITILRVIGGWVYTIRSGIDNSINTVFVPEPQMTLITSSQPEIRGYTTTDGQFHKF